MFGDHFYHAILRKSVAVFGTLFNNIYVVRRASDNRVVDKQRVPLSYGPRQKFLARIDQQADLSDPKVAIKLPRMSFEITNLAYDSTTKTNTLNKITTTSDTTTRTSVSQVTPYIVDMQLNIMAKNQDDALQIMEQILPTFQPVYNVSVKLLDDIDKSFDVPITLQSVSLNDDYEGDYTTRRVLIYTLDFSMKIKFFGDTSKAGIITQVIANMFNTDRVEHYVTEYVEPYSADKNYKTAKATANITNGVVTSVTINESGSGYRGALPTVTFSQSNTNATPTVNATFSGGSIDSLSLATNGFGYESVPNITISSPLTPAAALVNATINEDSGKVDGVFISPDSPVYQGYLTTPSLTIADPTGTQATATAVVHPTGDPNNTETVDNGIFNKTGFHKGLLTGLNITDSGIGYDNDATISVSAPNISSLIVQATGSTTINSSGKVDTISLINQGAYYSLGADYYARLESPSGGEGKWNEYSWPFTDDTNYQDVWDLFDCDGDLITAENQGASIRFWIKPTDFPGGQNLTILHTSNMKIHMNATNGEIQYNFGSNSGVTSGSYRVIEDQWNVVQIDLLDDQCRISVNGSSNTSGLSGSGTIISDGETIKAGYATADDSIVDTADRGFVGYLDDIRIDSITSLPSVTVPTSAYDGLGQTSFGRHISLETDFIEIVAKEWIEDNGEYYAVLSNNTPILDNEVKGFGYKTAPGVTFDAPTADDSKPTDDLFVPVTDSNGKIISFGIKDNVNPLWDFGFYYHLGDAPTVTIESPNALVTATASVTLDNSTGAVVGVQLDSQGQGYSSVPTVTVDTEDSNNYSTATATCTIDSTTRVATITLTDGGVGYFPSRPPTFTFDVPSADVRATGTAVVSDDGTITGITVTDGGFGYETAPLITIEAPSPTRVIGDNEALLTFSVVDANAEFTIYSDYAQNPNEFFTVGERVYGGNTGSEGEVVSCAYNALDERVETVINYITGYFEIGENLVGETSEVSHEISSYVVG